MDKHCFAPVVTVDTRLLILGSLPGDASLQAGQYYAHPRNQFWRLLQTLLQRPLVELPYPQRLAALRASKVGLWDVIASARRQGSLDTAIRQQRGNDLLALIATLPQLQAVAFNGGTAAQAIKLLQHLPLDLLALPSSSPAYTLTFDKKLEVWRGLSRYI